MGNKMRIMFRAGGKVVRFMAKKSLGRRAPAYHGASYQAYHAPQAEKTKYMVHHRAKLRPVVIRKGKLVYYPNQGVGTVQRTYYSKAMHKRVAAVKFGKKKPIVIGVERLKKIQTGRW